MNPLEKEVPSRKTCQEINFRGKTVYVWCNHEKRGFVLETYQKFIEYQKNCEPFTFFKAPTVTEFMRELPTKINDKPPHKDLIQAMWFYLEVKPYSYEDNNNSIKYYAAGYYNCGDFSIECVDNSPAEALAKLCLWCKKEGYL